MNIIIIGAGPAGMACAIEAKNENNNVILLEKNNRIGKKLLATGNGRCNYTNINLSENNYNHPEFVKDTLKEFSNKDLINYFKLFGLESTTDGNKVYPVTLKANTVLSVLMYWLERKNIEIITDTVVKSLEKTKNCLKVITNNGDFVADKVVVAFGGNSMPSSGSDGSSFKILRDLGHNITELKPALTQIKLESKFLKHLSGVKVIGKAKLFRKDDIIDERYGEILFTNYGISGPPILDMSVNCEKGDFIEVPIINNISDNILDTLYTRYYMFKDFSLENFLMGIVDKKFIHYIVDMTGIDKSRSMESIDTREFQIINKLLIKSRFKVIGNTGFKNSQVTRGGVSIKEINSYDFSSKIVQNLHIIGEALDIDGDCGGYNLHFAFASGYRLGKLLNNINN